MHKIKFINLTNSVLKDAKHKKCTCSKISIFFINFENMKKLIYTIRNYSSS